MILIMIGFWMWISLALDLGLDVDPSWTQLQQIPDESPLKTHSSYIEEHTRTLLHPTASSCGIGLIYELADREIYS